MFIEAITVCHNYSDFLEEVAPHNRPLIDRWVVITDPADDRTRSACRKFSIDCVTSEDHKRDGAFNKGRMIDRALAHVEGSGWLLHIDADIALPADFHQVLNDAHLDESCVYGCDRLNVVGYDAWKRVEGNGLLCRNNCWMVETDRPDCRLGARVANVGTGYAPIGFWTLWNGRESNWRSFVAKRYATFHGTAARTDCMFSLNWDRRKRVLIPELLVWHLESEPSEMGKNWKGRQSKTFGTAPTAATGSTY